MQVKINYYDVTTKQSYPILYTSHQKNESEAWLEICRLINGDDRFIKVYPSQFKIVKTPVNKYKRVYKYDSAWVKITIEIDERSKGGF